MITDDAAAEYPTVSIIIPVYNDQAGLDITLHSLGEQRYPGNSMEVIVVDNGSRPAMNIDPGAPAGTRLVHCETPGSYAARNHGVRCSSGQVLAFIDADCVATPGWIANGVRQALSDNAPVGGEVCMYTDNRRPTLAELLQLATGFEQRWSIEQQHFSVTANLIVPRSVFDRVGGFSEKLLSGGDRLWGWQAWAAGYPVRYADNAVVHHPCRSTVRSLVRQAVRVAGGRRDVADLQNIPASTPTLAPKRRPLDAFVRLWNSVPTPSVFQRVGVIGLATGLWGVRQGAGLLLRLGMKPLR
jgi:glycosyltransferase involved in cell wall biosynthesis